MAKVMSMILDDPPVPTRSRSLRTIVLGLLLAPLVYEGGLLCAANWRGMRGGDAVASTPCLDVLVRSIDNVSASASRSVSAVFHHVPWRAEYVLAIGFGWVIVGSLILKSRWK